MNRIKLSVVGGLITCSLTAAAVVGQSKPSNSVPQLNTKEKSLVTFVELGSVRCIPCRQMQPVMQAIEEKYGGQVKVVFYDVWIPEQAKYAQVFGIRVIPTQVFLDQNGKEFFRHEGFLPEAEIHKLLQSRGLKIRQGG